MLQGPTVYAHLFFLPHLVFLHPTMRFVVAHHDMSSKSHPHTKEHEGWAKIDNFHHIALLLACEKRLEVNSVDIGYALLAPIWALGLALCCRVGGTCK